LFKQTTQTVLLLPLSLCVRFVSLLFDNNRHNLLRTKKNAFTFSHSTQHQHHNSQQLVTINFTKRAANGTGPMSSRPEKPDSPPPSPMRGSIIAHRKRRVIFSNHSNFGEGNDEYTPIKNHTQATAATHHSISEVFVDDVKIAAAVKIHHEQSRDVDYYSTKVIEACKTNDIEIPHPMLRQVIRGVEDKCSRQPNGKTREMVKHYMLCSPERVKRFRKSKAVMKRPPSLAPTSSPIFRARQQLRERQLETKTIIDQKINEASKYIHSAILYNIIHTCIFTNYPALCHHNICCAIISHVCMWWYLMCIL
jgi:hypothetical protein